MAACSGARGLPNPGNDALDPWLGVEVEVLSPDTLRQAMAEEALRLIKVYNQN